jgi:adenylate cyclase
MWTRLWKRLVRPSGFKLGLLLTLGFCVLKYQVSSYEGVQDKSDYLRFMETLENSILDVKFRVRGAPTSAEERAEFQARAHVVIVAVDEKSTRVPDLGLWPWPRMKTAQLIEALGRCGARAIGFDAVFSEPDSQRAAPLIEALRQRYVAGEPQDLAFLAYLDEVLASVRGDARMAEALEASKNVVLGYFFFTSPEEIRHLDREDVIDRAMESIGFGTFAYIVRHARSNPERELPAGFGARANLPEFTDAVERYGFFNQYPDVDGVYRRMPWVYAYRRTVSRLPLARAREFDELWTACLGMAREGLETGQKKTEGGEDVVPQLFPSLSLQMLSEYYQQPVNLYLNTPDGETFMPRFVAVGIGPPGPVTEAHKTVLLEQGGFFRLNYYGPGQTFRHVSASDLLLDDPEACAAVQGKLVLFGVTTVGVYDLRPSPFSANHPGVELHATAIENILSGQTLIRPPDLPGLELLAMALVGLMLSWFLNRFRLTLGLVATLLFTLAEILGDYGLLFRNGIFSHNILLHVQTVALFLGIAVFRYATEEREKSRVRQAFQFYLSKDVVNEVLQDTSKLKLGGERRVLTVLFSDIRGFTTISEGLAPEALAELLNEYLTPMTELVFKHRGTLDKYMGDAIMAFFGAPVAYEDHADAACRTALEMMAELRVMQQGWKARGLPHIDIGIGVNTGPMSVGNMGSARRFDYTVLGDNVNLGSRLEGLNKNYASHIIASQFTREVVGARYAFRELDLVAVKGKKEPVRIYELLHAGPPTAEDAWAAEFEAGLVHYRAQRWDEALAVFRGLVGSRADPTSAIYVTRCEAMRQDPPGPGWDGVLTMKTK